MKTEFLDTGNRHLRNKTYGRRRRAGPVSGRGRVGVGLLPCLCIGMMKAINNQKNRKEMRGQQDLLC